MKLDTASMPSTSVLVRMLAAPIAPVDLAQVAGSASFPSSGGRVCGNEGVGVVEEAGSGSGLVKGSIVVPNTGGLGTWATHVISPGASWTAVPDSVAKGAIEPVAAGVAPYLAAKHLLEGFVKLSKGEWQWGKHTSVCVCRNKGTARNLGYGVCLFGYFTTPALQMRFCISHTRTLTLMHTLIPSLYNSQATW